MVATGNRAKVVRAQVSGMITDGATGEPLAGAVVVATDQPFSTHYWKSAPTGPDGRYHLSGRSTDACEVSVDRYARAGTTSDG